MEKFKVGDKVRILDVDSIMYGRDYWNNGDVTEVVDYLAGYPRLRTVKVSGHRLVITDDEFHAIELVEESTDEIEELKRRVSELEANVKRLESDRRTVELLADPVKFALTYAEGREEKTANERRKEANALRAEVIEKAKKVVAITDPFITEFIVNEEKRTVVALIRGSLSRKIRAKGIAKCAPSDVFNVHIGKAIALGRAYGLDVSEFEQAPQPTEPVLGMVVEVEGIFHPYVDPVISGSHYRNGIDALREYPERLIRIISDSEAQY